MTDLTVPAPRRTRTSPSGRKTAQPSGASAATATTLDPADWHKWQLHLSSRKPIAPAPARDKTRTAAPLVWGMESRLDDASQQWIVRLHESATKQKAPSGAAENLRQWLSASGHARSMQTAVEALAWARALPTLASSLPGDLWCQAFDLLRSAAADSATTPDAQPLVYQLLAVELAATLAHLFPELTAADELRRSARQAAVELVAATLDDDGMLAAERLSVLRPLWASLVRCRLLEAVGAGRIFDDEQRTKVDKLFRHAIRQTRPDGSAVFSPQAATTADFELLTSTADACHLPATRNVLRAVQRGETEQVKGLPHSAWYSEPQGLAVMRTRWAPPYDQTTVRFSAGDVELDIQSQGRPLFVGQWTWQATVNGQALHTDGVWEEVCWHSDADVDYLELELPLSHGWKLQRQFSLAREDRFLLLSEVLIGNEAQLSEPAEVRLSSQLPMVSNVAWEPAPESREGYLTVRNKRAAVALPIALPEWRSEFCHAELSVADGQLAQTAAARGKNLYLPLWLDLDPRRAQRGLTWRRLTVGEDLAIQPRDAAVGYRVRSGDKQWLVYRSLAGWGNRTVLGQNYSSEFVVCRFYAGGKSQDIIEIE